MNRSDETQKPVLISKNYEGIDGRLAGQEPEKALTLGLSADETELLGTLWGKDGENWQTLDSQSFSRILDMAIFLAQGNLYFQEAYRYEKFYNPEDPQVAIIGLQGGRMTVAADTENPQLDQDILAFHDLLQKDGELLGQRFRTLKRLLDEAGY
ncbi:DUF6530 family protein [Enterococcus asini]|uniref:DUF6530 family protein n=1 Tax=Enterococcus asini TaxID=57732 RepID=UPI00241C2C4D|nr:DUF6530 family protein [Enterococcus asini]